MTDPTVDQLRARLDATPAAIARSIATADAFVAANEAAMRAPTRWALSGIGASEGVARAMSAWIQREGDAHAEFVSFSRWLDDEASTKRFDGVVVFSQGLSPNARIAIERGANASTRILVTASPAHPFAQRARDDGWLVCAHEPADEGALLVRLTGPACALAAARVLSESSARDRNGHRARADVAFAEGVDEGWAVARAVDVASLEHVRAMLCSGGDDETHAGLAWTWMESTLSAPVAMWDVLGFAHGPYQSLFERRAALIALEHAHNAQLFDGVEAMLDRERHTLVRVRAGKFGALSVFSHMGALWALAISLLERRPRDLAAWPGKGRDKPLYDITG